MELHFFTDKLLSSCLSISHICECELLNLLFITKSKHHSIIYSFYDEINKIFISLQRMVIHSQKNITWLYNKNQGLYKSPLCYEKEHS